MNRLWKVHIDKAIFCKLRSDPRFRTLLALSRFVNALRFVDTAARSYPSNDDSPAARHQRTNGFLFTAALLFEGIGLAERLATHFRDLASFQNGFKAILASTSVQRLRTLNLKQLRNRLVFHYDSDEHIEDFLKKLPDDDYVFAVGWGNTQSGTRFDMADLTAISVFVSDFAGEEDLLRKWNDLVPVTVGLAKQYLDAADMLIAEALPTFGATLQQCNS